MNYSEMKTLDLVSQFNGMLAANKSWLDPKDWRPVKKFENHDTAVRRCSGLAHAIKEHKDKMEAQAATSAAAKPARAPRDPSKDPTLHQLTEQFNEHFDKAVKDGLELGAWARHHTSDFASRDGALKQIERIKLAVIEARKPKPAPKASAA